MAGRAMPWTTLGLAAMAALGAATAVADSPADSFGAYAVEIVRGPAIRDHYHAAGAGIYMGKGLVLTAAHVGGHPTDASPDTVVVDDRYAAAVAVKAGSLDGVDITLLSVDRAALPGRMLRLAPLKLCVDSPIPGQTVTVVAPGNVRDSVIVSPSILPPNMPKYLTTLIRDVYNTGNSGSGVFDPEIGCLMGIMSKKIETTNWRNENGVPLPMREGIAKYFVPAKTIAEFLDRLL